MSPYVLWFVSYLSLFMSLFWINVMFLRVPERREFKKLPFVSMLIPARNEENNIRSCIDSIINSGYDKTKLRVIVIDDESRDRTGDIVRSLIREYQECDIKLIRRVKKYNEFTKAPALNVGLKYVKGDYVGCIDADSTIEKGSLQNVTSLFEGDEVGAVISNIKVNRTKSIWEKVQRLEYIFATFIRSLMSKIDTLHVTPGALSVYRTDVLKKVGGFDEKNITEDLEVAMNIRYHGYKVKIALDSISYTNVPETFRKLWRQRVRWFRGFIYNTRKYKGMLMNKKYGLLGTFQYPINILTIACILLTFSFTAYEFFKLLYRSLVKLSLVKLGAFNFYMFRLQDLILLFNFKLFFPMIASLVLAFYIYFKAHKVTKERWKHPSALIVYLTVFPILRSLHWVIAFIMEVIGIRGKW